MTAVVSFDSCEVRVVSDFVSLSVCVSLCNLLNIWPPVVSKQGRWDDQISRFFLLQLCLKKIWLKKKKSICTTTVQQQVCLWRPRDGRVLIKLQYKVLFSLIRPQTVCWRRPVFSLCPRAAAPTKNVSSVTPNSGLNLHLTPKTTPEC